jgi:hypothetical protein
MWTRRDQFDLKNGIILTFLAIIVVLYSKLIHLNLVATSNFSREQKAYDNKDHDFDKVSGLGLVTNIDTSRILETETTHNDGLVEYTRTTPMPKRTSSSSS